MDKVHEQKAHSKEVTEKRMSKVIHNQINENEKDMHFFHLSYWQHFKSLLIGNVGDGYGLNAVSPKLIYWSLNHLQAKRRDLKMKHILLAP